MMTIPQAVDHLIALAADMSDRALALEQPFPPDAEAIETVLKALETIAGGGHLYDCVVAAKSRRMAAQALAVHQSTFDHVVINILKPARSNQDTES